MKYRKKPVVIEAFQWTGGPEQEDDPEWIIEAVRNGSAWFENEGTPEVKFMIRTPEGVHEASVGDYIIHGIAGEIYPCKPDIFRETYELEEETVTVAVHLDGDEITKAVTRDMKRTGCRLC
ncbi:MAG: hypothetical protein ENTA_03292 [Enterocloster clostridioformis]|uniref:hypothetical protein n=1 Tax=Enterocloster clostridioformis TaxID=1531 RepID=UPI00232AD47F|nr:hypothetical protein [Enterocloster clostridioformis]MDB2133146.1 hypothetical protein [Enterocloster clostridioformis]